MGEIRTVTENDLTRDLAERLRKLWDAYVRLDEEAHSAILAKEYRAVHPDGTVHVGKPSGKEFAAAPIEDYWLTELQAWPTGSEGAVATYTAEVQAVSGGARGRFRFEVGEVWLREGGQWKCRYYHATPRK
jgi:hypothetical protein